MTNLKALRFYNNCWAHCPAPFLRKKVEHRDKILYHEYITTTSKESHYAQQDYTEDKSLYSGLSWVLQGRGYEEDDANDARQKRMAIQKIPPLYRETVDRVRKESKGIILDY